MDFNLAGRTAVVTGGSKGIGLAVVRLLAASGARLPAGEHLPVVRQDLPGHPVAAQRLRQRQAHRPGRGPQHDLRAHDEPGVIIDAGDDLDQRHPLLQIRFAITRPVANVPLPFCH
jgi:NAD(P)-dependent dehydrogenase (short-subunit alcohol dehydrogenase family)